MQIDAGATTACSELLDRHCEQQIRRAKRRAAKLLKRLQPLVLGANGKRYRGLASLILKSHDCKLSALCAANARLKQRFRRRPTQLVAEAERMNLWESEREIVRVSSAAKKTGGQRCLMAFGLANRARQILVKWVLEPWIRPRLLKCQHVLNGGRDAAIRACKLNIEKGGHKWGSEIDIKDCFGSIDVAWLKDVLPIPPRIIDTVIGAGELNLVANGLAAPLHLSQNRMGIPQGSAVSPLIAEFVNSDVLKRVPDGTSFEVYVDNVFCFADSEGELQRHRKSFERLYKAHPAGSFSVRSSEPKRLSAGMTMLGYAVRRVVRRVEISIRNDRLQAALECLKVKLNTDFGDRGSESRIARRFLSSWSSSYKLDGRVALYAQLLRLHVARFGLKGIEKAARIYRGPPGGRSLVDYMMPSWPRFSKARRSGC